MTRCTIRNCRSMVLERKPFQASTLMGDWKTAADGTELYVVTSALKQRGYGTNYCTLFVNYDGKWYECSNLPARPHRRGRSQQMYFARPLWPSAMLRVDRVALRLFALQGLAHHPDMTRLLNVSV